MVLTVKPGPTRTTIYRSDFATFHRERLSDFVYSGFASSDGGGLNLTVAAGTAYISGWRISHSEASTVLLADNKTNEVWLDKDGVFYAQDSQPSESIQIAEVVTSAGAITLITDKRPLTELGEAKISFLDTGGHDHSGASAKGTKVNHGNLLGVAADQHHAKLHQADHQDAGVDEITGALDPRAYPMLADVIANRPVAGVSGRFFWSTDEHILYRDNGATWDKAAAADHADLTGLANDEHTQYLKEEASGGLASEVPDHTHQDVANCGKLDHGLALDGLADDDHTQYLNDARHQENHRLRKAQAAPTPGVNDVYGTAVQVSPSSGSDSLYPKGIKLTWGGTFGAETVTIRTTFQFSDATSLSVEKSATAVGSQWLSDDDFLGVWKDAVRITRIDVDSKTSIASTSVTTTVDIIGDQN
jgi:hypothetical protein